MRCANCGRVIYSRKNYLGVKVWEHQSDGCRACDVEAREGDATYSDFAEPDWENLIGGFGSKMDELSGVKR